MKLKGWQVYVYTFYHDSLTVTLFNRYLETDPYIEERFFRFHEVAIRGSAMKPFSSPSDINNCC